MVVHVLDIFTIRDVQSPWGCNKCSAIVSTRQAVLCKEVPCVLEIFCQSWLELPTI